MFKKNNSDYKYFLDYKTNPSKYTGMPQMSKAKKMSELTNYSIPLDANGYSTKKNLIGINLASKEWASNPIQTMKYGLYRFI